MLLLELFVLGQFLVQIGFEQAGEIMGRTPLNALVYEIKGLAVDRQNPNDTVLEHSVKIVGPWLRQLCCGDTELFALRLLSGGLDFGSGIRRTGEQ